MKILSLHCDYIKFKPVKKAIKEPEKLSKEGEKEKNIKECLVILTAVEKKDEENETQIAKLLIENIKDISEQVKCKKIVLYPYVHLSSEPSSPSFALNILKQAELELKKEKFDVTRAPFGYYKEFELKCKGHALAELSRVIILGEKKAASESVSSEKKLVSEWFILDRDGKLNKIKSEKGKIIGFDFSKYKKLEKFASYEISKVREVKEEPPHAKLMRKLEIADYEPGSDPGNLRFYPKGRLIKALLEKLVTKKMQEYGAIEVETPIMYDFEHPTFKSYLNRFPARQYIVQTPNKKAFLRFSACFGQFLMLKDATISYKDLPLKIYELTKYSFRAEQRGELTGLRRLRAFTMPDCHCLCLDLKQAKQEMLERFALAKQVLNASGLKIPEDLELAIRVTKDFWKDNKEHLIGMVKNWGKPALLEMWDERFFYFVTKYEMNFVDNLDKASALATDQIDIENAERYGITYTSSDSKKKYPLILHLSPSGAIERVIYALLEKAYEQEHEKKVSSLPYWLSPTQCRIVPVSEKYIKEASELAEDLNEKESVRTDVDDRNLHVSKKILEAEQEWIPYIIVLGEQELKEQILSVRERGIKDIKKIKPYDFKKILKQAQNEMPFLPLPLPCLLSKRPRFV